MAIRHEPCTDGTMKKIIGEGRFSKLKPAKFVKILRHHLEHKPDITQEKFCKRINIGISTYFRVIHFSFKQQTDKDKFLSAANNAGIDFDDVNKKWFYK